MHCNETNDKMRDLRQTLRYGNGKLCGLPDLDNLGVGYHVSHLTFHYTFTPKHVIINYHGRFSF